MFESSRVVVFVLVLLMLSETGLNLFQLMQDCCSKLYTRVNQHQKTADTQEEKQGVLDTLDTITSHCLPKLVCQLYSLTSRDEITDAERHLINIIGSVGVTGAASKYSYAAHMGQLVRGLEGQGCHNFYPCCPFSNTDVMELARRIYVK